MDSSVNPACIRMSAHPEARRATRCGCAYRLWQEEVHERYECKVAASKDEVDPPADVGDSHWDDLDDDKCRQPSTY